MKQSFTVEGALLGDDREVLGEIERAIIASRVKKCKWRTEMVVTYYDDGISPPNKDFYRINRLVSLALRNEGIAERVYVVASVFIGRSRPHILVELEDMA